MNVESWTLQDDVDAVTFLDEHGEGLTGWEVDFVESCAKRVNRMHTLSVRQRETLVRITSERIDP